MTLDFDTLQPRSGVHSTLGHFNNNNHQSTTISNGPSSTIPLHNHAMDMTNPLQSQDTSAFNTTGLLLQSTHGAASSLH